jgi:MORN repeat protein
MIRSPSCKTNGYLSKTLLLLALLAVLPGLGYAQQSEPGWLADSAGCRVWNPFPNPDESIKWEGGCVDGFAHGRGRMLWFESGQLMETDEGEYKNGKLNGFAVLVFTDGQRFEGNFVDHLPHGQGTLRTSDGQTFSGQWSYGCFRDGNQTKAFGTTLDSCEFH